MDWRVLLQQAMQAHQKDDLDGAERGYREVLELRVAQPDALHYLGVLCHQRGRSDEGAELIRTSLRITPKHPDAHNNLGNVLKESGHLAEAEGCYRRALDCGPDHYNAMNNLAVVLEAQERPEEAFQAYSKLLEMAPEFARGYYLMGTFLRNFAQSMEHLEQSVECFRRAIALDKDDLRALQALGVGLYALNQPSEAAQVYREWLAREPDNPVPQHMLAACGGAEAPSRAGDDYVRDTFDGFADSFDEQLLQNLGYRAPEVLVSALGEFLGDPRGALDVLDAGCGTGLCAGPMRPWTRRLAGVDLSGRMVEKARLRGGYEELEVAEITHWLEQHPQAYDVVLSADTLVYFGELQPVLQASHDALRPGGWVGFTLEASLSDDQGFELTPSGRYRHARGYVETTLEHAGFGDVVVRSDRLRKESGRPVEGWVVLGRRKDD
ncbi:tetratricopeptide repeat protein [Rhodanobacter sp. AS-Z3]|uniref:tetratricopeptide repeat protein n=1 Tax=Rhodanobacter sp. AS-Z3 TaxID=3031330 RepID=UPI002479B517|nr:tetratricopeptide repeat protein [Rhodanobacter sp. AS-Z3]WEN16900.1 tetratricopeptide repeat protein [Rhodanobacter sp. AS-Z3]